MEGACEGVSFVEEVEVAFIEGVEVAFIEGVELAFAEGVEGGRERELGAALERDFIGE